MDVTRFVFHPPSPTSLFARHEMFTLTMRLIGLKVPVDAGVSKDDEQC
jgi:hypothetical protein